MVPSRTRAWLALVTLVTLIGLAQLAACADRGEPVLELPRWSLRTSTGAELPVHLPVDLDLGHDRGRGLGARPGAPPASYVLVTDVSLPAPLEQGPLVLTIQYLPAHASLSVDGTAAVELDRAAWDVRRATGPHAWRIHDHGAHVARAGAPLHLELTVDCSSMLSWRLDTVPRLSATELGDSHYVAIKSWNFITGFVCIGGLTVLIFIFAVSYATDLSQREHAWFISHIVCGVVIGLWFTGLAQLPFGSFEIAVVHAAFFFSICFNYGFVCDHFGVGFPHRLLATAAGASLITLLLFRDPYSAVRYGIPVQLALGLLLLGHLVFRLYGIARRHELGGEARVLLCAWLLVVVLGTPDMLGASGQGRPLGGLHLVPMSMFFYVFLNAALIVRDRARHLERTKQLAASLDARILHLEQRDREIQSLNTSLQRQIADRSRELSEAIAAVSSPRRALLELAEGHTIDERYEIVDRLGAGGMGMVFEVIRRDDGARLALKVLRETEPNKQARLAREAQIAADVQHPNIIRVVDVGVAAHIGVFVVMELIRGRSLEQYRRSYGDLDFSLDVLKQVLRGLAALHRAGVAHRDLKPANVLLDGSSPPLAKVTDFGVSGLVGATGLAETLSADSDRLTVAGMVLGTPRYMAPEQIDLSESGTAADLFSFGIMATEVLTGTYPFDEPPVMALHHLRELPKVLPVHDRLPAALRAVLVACLAESPDERPKAEQVLAVLEGLTVAKVGTAGG